MFKSSLPIALKDVVFYLKCTRWLLPIPWLLAGLGRGSSKQRGRGGEGEVGAWSLQEGLRGCSRPLVADVPSLGAVQTVRGWGAMLCLGRGGSEPSPLAGSEGLCPAPHQLSLSELAGQLKLGGLHQGACISLLGNGSGVVPRTARVKAGWWVREGPCSLERQLWARFLHHF